MSTWIQLYRKYKGLQDDLINAYYYQGISRCNKTIFQAYVRHGFWAGYMLDDVFCTSPCPLGFCKYISSTETIPYCRKLLKRNLRRFVGIIERAYYVEGVPMEAQYSFMIQHYLVGKIKTAVGACYSTLHLRFCLPQYFLCQ